MWQPMTSIQKTLLEIQDNQSFEQLEALTCSKVWTEMSQSEKDLFCFLLLKWGAQQLASGSTKVLNTFSLAVQLSSQATQTLFEQGVIFASHTENSRCLEWAHEAFLKITAQQPLFLMAWYHLAQVCISQGKLQDESSYFADAHTYFDQCEALLKMEPSPQGIQLGNFYYQWGYCQFLLGKCSGEPIDFYLAIHCYQRAEENGYQESSFFNNYGLAFNGLALLVDKPELHLEALKYFEQVIELVPDCKESWCNYADCFFQLAELTNQESYFEQANLAFERAVELDSFNPHLWYRWAQQDALLGRLKRDEKLLELSCGKFSRARELDPDQCDILSAWADVELFLGSMQERLDLIQSARSKLAWVLELHPENADSWCAYGTCLHELGRYFDEPTFFVQAIEKFNYALSLPSHIPFTYYALALSHFAMGEEEDDIIHFECALRFYSKYVESGGTIFPHLLSDWGCVLMKIGEITEQESYIEMAIEKFERALKRLFDSDYSEYDNSVLESFYNYGYALDLLGEFTDEIVHFEKAIQVFSKILQMDPSCTHARYNLALAFFHLGEMNYDIESYKKAIEHFQILLTHDAENELLYLDFGILLINLSLLIQDAHHLEKSQGLYRQAEVHLMHAASLGNCQAFYQLAGLYSLTYQYSLAMHYLERAHSCNVLPVIDDLIHDEWLEGLRKTQVFRDFLNYLSGNA